MREPFYNKAKYAIDVNLMDTYDKIKLSVDKIKNKIEEEVEAELKKMADSYQMELDKIKEMMGDSEKKQIKKDLAVQKAVDYVVENAKESKPRATKASKAAAEDEAKEE